MLFLWILLFIAIIVFLNYSYLIIKRFIFIRKISKRTKNSNGNIQYCRHPLASVFKHDGKTDLSISSQEKTIDISIITTPFRRVRYHFDINNKLLELVVERRSVYIKNPRVPGPSAVMDRVYTIRKYKIEFENLDKENQKYVILNPAPTSTSKAEGSTLAALGNGDILFDDVRICGLKWFIENII